MLTKVLSIMETINVNNNVLYVNCYLIYFEVDDRLKIIT